MGKILQQRALGQLNKIKLNGKPLVKIPTPSTSSERRLSRGGRARGAGAANAASAPRRHRRSASSSPARGALILLAFVATAFFLVERGLAGAQPLRPPQLPRARRAGRRRRPLPPTGRPEPVRGAPVRLRHGADVAHRDAAGGAGRGRARALHHRRGAASACASRSHTWSTSSPRCRASSTASGASSPSCRRSTRSPTTCSSWLGGIPVIGAVFAGPFFGPSYFAAGHRARDHGAADHHRHLPRGLRGRAGGREGGRARARRDALGDAAHVGAQALDAPASSERACSASAAPSARRSR